MRPHSSFSKLSESQLPNLINRDSLHYDHSSAMLTKWGKHEEFPSWLGNPNKQLFPREQDRPLVSSSQEVWSGSTLQSSLHEASKKTMNWVPRNTQPALFSHSEGRKQVEQSAPFENAWKRLASKHSASDPHQQSLTPTSESSSRATGFGYGFGDFAGSKSFTPGLPKRNDISMAPTTPQSVWRKITLSSLPSNAVSHNVLQTDPSTTSLSTSPIASPAQNHQYPPHQGDSKVLNLPGLAKSNVASPIHINSIQKSTCSANTFFQQPWNIRNEQVISMFGLRTANPSPSVDANVVAKTDPSNNGLATSSHDVASNEANSQIPRYGDIKMSEVTDVPGDNIPAAVCLKQSNVASSANIETNIPDTKNVSTLFQHYGSLKSGQMISMSDPGTGSALPSENATELVKASRARFSGTRRSKPRGDATVLVETPRKRASRSSRLQPSRDTTVDVKKPRQRDKKSRRRQPSVDAAEVVKSPEKRKAETFHHKEALQDLSTAEIEWAHGANCLPEKVEEETPLSETEDRFTRPNKRLIVTSQCIQQLLPAPPMALLQADAAISNKSILYFVAKSASEVAFNMACSFTSCHQVPRDKTNFISEKLKFSEKPEDKNLSRVIGNCIKRTKKLEENLTRYNKKASVGEVRLECKDLMRKVVGNRYTKVHTSEEEEAATSEKAAVNSVIQPYVTKLLMPSNPPKGIVYHPL